MIASKLTELQRTLLAEFFRREKGFFLTGGGALAGYHLGHRTTKDLDLFSTEDRLDAAETTLAEIAKALGGTIEALTRAPSFRRWLFRQGDAAVVVDLARDLAPQLHPDKPLVDGVPIDPPDEILVNKLSALMSRSEIRDLVDARALERAGYSIEDALRKGQIKDASLTPAQLGWVLSQITFGDATEFPGGVSVPEMRAFLSDLISRLSRLALPGSK